MTSERDDALSWGGDDDPTLDAASPAPEVIPARQPSLPKGYAAVGKGSDTVNDEPATPVMADEKPAERKPMGNAALVTIGVLGGAYGLYVIGWIIGGLRLQGLAQYLVTDVMFLGSFWLAALAPIIWFGTTFLLTRHSSTWLRVVWLVAGLVLLVPWPFVMTGTVGQ